MINTCHRPRKVKHPHSLRRGIVLIIVMVVVVMISLAGFGFVVSMSNENKVVHLRGEQLQMENAVASAEEFLKQFLERPRMSESSPPSNDDNEELMRGVVVTDEGGLHGRVRFTVMAPHYDETATATWHYGLARESSRLDLRTVLDWETRQSGTGQKALLGLPGMTDAIADALLDWMDRDSTPRPSGAEDDYYATMNPPYAPRNGVPDSLEELLLIKGVTRSLLFGRDANQNHRLDLDEQSSARAPEQRDPAGERSVPWTELLTLYSNERNQTRDGEPRIDLNQLDLGQLHRQLSTAFDSKLATYVVLFRQFGPYLGSGKAADLGIVKPNFASPAKLRFRSLLELLQSRVQVPAATGIAKIVDSPLPNEREKLDGLLGMLCDRVTVSNQPILPGLVNVNFAPPEVLRTIPGIDKALADQIVASRTSTAGRNRRRDEHPCWLLTDGLVNLHKMKEILPYLTVGGDVYRTQIVAFSETSRLSQRVEVVLDASRGHVRRLFWKDLQVLGRGYPWDVLDTPGGVSYTQTGASDATPLGH